MTVGLIISAGNQTRFNSEVPKALAKYKGKPLLEHNIENLKTVCDNIVVVVNYIKEPLYYSYNHVVIPSGSGCGDAVLKGLLEANIDANDTVIVQWGDTLHTPELYKQLVNTYNEHKKWIIPCVMEEHPYVQIVPHVDSVRAMFSKYNDPISEGYHDLSVFCGNAGIMIEALQEFAHKHLSTSADHLYEHPHNNELQFLDVFNEMGVPAKILDMGSYKDFSFNTIEQFIDACDRISR